MFSGMIYSGAVQFFRQLSLGSFTAATPRTVRLPIKDVAVPDDACERAVVLRTLIEEFGGEVLSSTLGRRLVGRFRQDETKSEVWMFGVLEEFQNFGAVTLEDVREGDRIVRVLPVGVNVAYAFPRLDRSREDVLRLAG